MKPFGYLVPNKEMVKIAEDVFDANKYEAAVEIGNMTSAIEKARKMIDQGAMVIIARGATALYLRNVLTVPVIDIPVTLEEIAEAILRASMIGKKIAVLGGYNLIQGLKPLTPLLNVDLEQTYIRDTKEIRAEILRHRASGKDVIIGGDMTCAIAAELQVKSVILQSSPQSITHAYREANAFLSTLLAEKRRKEEIRTILDYTQEGYIAINKAGKITLANKAARRLTRSEKTQLVGKSIDNVFPELQDALDIVSSGKESAQDIALIGGTTLVYDRIPVRSNDGKVTGAIIAFQNIDAVREKVSKIRRTFYHKGFYAKYTLEDIKGSSNPIKTAIEYAKTFAAADATVLLTGRTGVGKELFAQGIHNMSNRQNGPFIGVNCASLPENLLESELFGYEEGAFTGARKSGKAGMFELAQQGTLFLDEVSEIPLALQSRLLRVLQERQVIRLGSDKVMSVDARIIAATNSNLADLVAQKKFREDLYFRLNVLSLRIPTLAERKDDVPVLAQSILDEKAKNRRFRFTDAAITTLKDYSWPGNVRELQNMMEKIAIISTSDIIDSNDIKELLLENKSLVQNRPVTVNPSFRRRGLSREKVLEAIALTNGNRDGAAEILNVHRTTLWRWLRKNGV